MKDKDLIILMLVGGGLFLLCIIVSLALFVFGGIFIFRTETTPAQIDPEPSSSGSGISTSPASKTCVRAGCSSELCLPKDQAGEIATDCSYKMEYSCYSNNFAKCEIQQNGKCGWTQSEELNSCITELK